MKKTYKPGDEVWVAQRVENRMRPVKLNVFAVQTTDYGLKKTVVYFGPTGSPIESEVFPTIEVCEQAINIIEKHAREFNKAMAELLGGEPSGLVDARGKKMV